MTATKTRDVDISDRFQEDGSIDVDLIAPPDSQVEYKRYSNSDKEGKFADTTIVVSKLKTVRYWRKDHPTVSFEVPAGQRAHYDAQRELTTVKPKVKEIWKAECPVCHGFFGKEANQLEGVSEEDVKLYQVLELAIHINGYHHQERRFFTHLYKDIEGWKDVLIDGDK